MTREDEILGITEVGDLFSNDLDKCKSEYRDLVKTWHPDENTDDTSEVFAKINDLYNKALDMISKGVWEKTNFIQLQSKDGKKIAINYLAALPFELGVCYVCKKHIIYKFDSDKKKYYDNALLRLKSLTYKDSKMKDYFSKFFPDVFSTYETDTGCYCIVLNKTEDVFPLRLVLDYFDGKFPDKHTAWVITRLSDICCFLNQNNLVHNGITIDNCFVSIEYHTVLLLGGWGYTVSEGERLIGTTKEVFDLMPVKERADKIASPLTDLESVKMIGRKLLGESNSRRLLDSDLAPKPFLEFLVSGSEATPYKQLESWGTTLTDAYGERKFIKLEISSNDIYNKTKGGI